MYKAMLGAYNPQGQLLRQGSLSTIKKFLEELHPTCIWRHGEYNGIRAFWRIDNDTNETLRGFIHTLIDNV